jgi:hypothetical protein
MRTLRFALWLFLLPQCWSKMMTDQSCWLQSPHGLAFSPQLSLHLSNPLSPSGAWFSRPPLFWLTTLHQSLNTSSFCQIICLGWLVLRLLSWPLWHPNLCSNGSDMKTHWTSEELHHALGCRRFHNYRHIIQTILDGEWVDGGEFPLLLGSYTTIPKAPRGGSIDQEDFFFSM